jgi:hypothetical protein
LSFIAFKNHWCHDTAISRNFDRMTRTEKGAKIFKFTRVSNIFLSSQIFWPNPAVHPEKLVKTAVCFPNLWLVAERRYIYIFFIGRGSEIVVPSPNSWEGKAAPANKVGNFRPKKLFSGRRYRRNNWFVPAEFRRI